MRGLKIIALVRSHSSAEILKNGTKDVPVISTEDDNWAEAVKQAFGQAPSIAMDPISGEMTSKLLGLLADGGTLLIYGSLDYRPPQIQTTPIIIHQYGLRGVTAPTWLTSTSAEQRVSDIQDLFEIARKAPQNFADAQEFALADAVDALAAIQATPRRSAVVLASN
jgi:NADPH:quinone reductase-like Zn-dependent oxidoreductase